MINKWVIDPYIYGLIHSLTASLILYFPLLKADPRILTLTIGQFQCICFSEAPRRRSQTPREKKNDTCNRVGDVHVSGCLFLTAVRLSLAASFFPFFLGKWNHCLSINHRLNCTSLRLCCTQHCDTASSRPRTHTSARAHTGMLPDQCSYLWLK